MKLAKWACYLLIFIGIIGSASKIFEGEIKVGIQLLVFCLIVAAVALIFIHYCLGPFGGEKRQ